MKKAFWILQILFMVSSLSMCKNLDKMSKVYKTDVKNPYKFNTQIKSLIYKDSLNPNYEYAATLYSLNSNFKKALSIWDSITDSPSSPKTKIDTNFIRNEYSIHSAKGYLIQESQNTSLVILNEAHHNNSHKVFAESLLSGLYKNGYRLLFLEALNNGKHADTLLNERKYPITSSGFYVKNPQFGNFIRKALNIGFKVFPYETTASGRVDEKVREKDQANNINNILEKYPKEKALIYVGYGHNREGKVPYWNKAMAERLKELTGIDPLTISQDRYSEKSSRFLSNPLLVKLNLKKPSVLLDNNNVPYRTAIDSSWTDIAIFHPFTSYKNQRPDWLFYDGKKSVSIDLKEVKIEFPIMIMAYNNNDEITNQAIPLDIVEIENKEEKATLVLNRGNYVIKIINNHNSYQLLDKTVY